MSATSKTIIRMWNKDGYHKDVAILDSDQVRMTEQRITQPNIDMQMASGGVISVVINQQDFPEAVAFQIIVQEYRR